MTQADKAAAFAALHKPGDPLVLYNIWDAGSAKAVAEAGASALATGSWSVAAAQGYGDGEAIPLELLLTVVERIVATVDLPLTVDFEGAYAETPEGVAANVKRLIAACAVGCNFEDQVVGGEGFHPVEAQAARIAAMRAAADETGVPFYINARTDFFLKEKDAGAHAALVPEAQARATAYEAAGASGFFIPGLSDLGLIGEITGATPLPVNVMAVPGAPDASAFAGVGVARISHGPFPYRKAMKALGERYLAEV